MNIYRYRAYFLQGEIKRDANSLDVGKCIYYIAWIMGRDILYIKPNDIHIVESQLKKRQEGDISLLCDDTLRFIILEIEMVMGMMLIF